MWEQAPESQQNLHSAAPSARGGSQERRFPPGAGPGVEFALSMQAAAGNRAVARVLNAQREAGQHASAQRQSQNRSPSAGENVSSDPRQALGPLPGAFARDDPLGAMGPGPAIYTRLAEWLARRHYSNQLHGELVSHYVRGNAAPFVLSRARMVQVIAPGGIGLNFLWDDTRWSRIHDAQRQIQSQLASGQQQTVTVWVNDQSVVACDRDKPTLGAFTCWVDGAVTGFRGAQDPNSGDTALEFSLDGTMHWYDWWDFDPHVSDSRGFPQTRTADAERGTRRAHDWLPGRPFAVTSDTVRVRQPRGQERGGALW